MGKEDVERAYRAAPQATVIAIHLEGISLATQTRQDVRNFVRERGLDPRRVLIPADGEAYRF